MELILLSASTNQKLTTKVETLLNSLSGNEESVTLRSVALACNSRDKRKSSRTAIAARSLAHLREILAAKLFIVVNLSPIPTPTVGFLFTSQGCQYFGMGKKLYEKFPVFKNSLLKYEAVFEHLTGSGFQKGIWETEEFFTVFSQPVLFCFQLALVDLWRSLGVTPDAVMGHSFGEYAAAVCAGAMTVDTGLTLAHERFRLVLSTMETCPGKMIGISATEAVVEGMIADFATHAQTSSDWLDVCAVNSPEEVIVAGPKARVEAFEKECSLHGVRTRLTVSPVAFHSRAMDPIMPAFQERLKVSEFSGNLNCTYVSATYGAPIEGDLINGDYWLKHLRQRMLCGRALMEVWSRSDILIEIGPREVLVHKVRENLKVCPESAKSVDHLIFPTMKRDDKDFEYFYELLTTLYLNGIDLKLA